MFDIESASIFLNKIFQPDKFRRINEVHGSIAQMLRQRCHGALVGGLLDLAEGFGHRHGIPGWRDAVAAMISHYPKQII